MAHQQLVIVDADTLAGWRRTTASMDQLLHAVADLRAQAPDAIVAIVGDPSLKWALPEAERETLDREVREGRLVFAPAGSLGGHVGFIARIAEKARAQGLTPIAVTDRSVPDCPVSRIGRSGDQWTFDLTPSSAPSVVAPATGQRRRRSRPG